MRFKILIFLIYLFLLNIKVFAESKPIKKNIKLVNLLMKNGHYIKLFTSRYMGRNNENKFLAKKQSYNFTKKQLKKWKVNYHKLIFGKPSYDVFIDDKNLGHKKNWASILFKKRRHESC